MKTLFKFIAWLFSVVFFVLAFFVFYESILSCFLLAICGILCNPLLYYIYELRIRNAFTIAPIFLFLAYSVTPVTEIPQVIFEKNFFSQQEGYYEYEKEDTAQEGVTVKVNADRKEPLVEEESNEETVTSVIEEENKNNNSDSVDSILEVHFIDVGQGDSTLLICDGEAMLIDAGDNSKGTTIQLYLKKHGVEKLKYVICTHPDSDHIGGMDVILYKYDCETIIMPDRSSDTNTYRDVIDTLAYKNYSISFPVVGKEYYLGKAKFVILGPGRNYSDENNCSVSIRLSHGYNSFIFTGDADEEAESDYIRSGRNLKSTVLKVGHHGSRSSSSEDFLNAVEPQYAVISCGKNNSYGHPHFETLNYLWSLDCQVFRTDEHGSIVATSDEKTLTWYCSSPETSINDDAIGNQDESVATTNITDETPVVSYQSEATSAISNNAQVSVENESYVSPEPYYILNTNTKKFHIPSCSSVKTMSPKNIKKSFDSKETIMEDYEPCKKCNP